MASFSVPETGFLSNLSQVHDPFGFLSSQTKQGSEDGSVEYPSANPIASLIEPLHGRTASLPQVANYTGRSRLSHWCKAQLQQLPTVMSHRSK